MNDHIAAARCCGIGSNYAVGDCATETVMTAFSIEPEQMVAIGVRLAAPELPDHAAFENTWCIGGLRFAFFCVRLPSTSIRLARSS